MDQVQEALFAKFPRSVGNPNQFWVFDKESMDMFIDKNNGSRNVYASISRFGQGGASMTSMLSLDLDTPVKEVTFPHTDSDDERIMMMREREGKANEVLSTVVEDAEKLARYCRDEAIPMVGVFTGFGIHIHMLYKEAVEASEELSTMAHHLVDELNLSTVDRKPIGDTSRLLRIPNCHRMENGRKCSLYTIPVSIEELIAWEPEDFLEESLDKRVVDIPDMERPSMEVRDDYLSDNGKTQSQRDLSIDPSNIDYDWVRWFLKEALKMPCMYQRLMQNDPGHMVRLNGAVMLYNIGLGPDQVFEVFRALDWNDWDAPTTKKQLRQIYKRSYADMSCQTLQQQGLCVFGHKDRKMECPTYDWKGGNQKY